MLWVYRRQVEVDERTLEYLKAAFGIVELSPTGYEAGLKEDKHQRGDYKASHLILLSSYC